MRKLLPLFIALSLFLLGNVDAFAAFVYPCSVSVNDSIENAPSSYERTKSKFTSEQLDSLIIDKLERIDLNQFQYSFNRRYKLYPTENVYTFLKLDTETGKIDQIQWSLDKDKEGSLPINRKVLSYDDIHLHAEPRLQIFTEKFVLVPTKNMFQFILLNTQNGETWHVQWGFEEEKRWIRRIY